MSKKKRKTKKIKKATNSLFKYSLFFISLIILTSMIFIIFNDEQQIEEQKKQNNIKKQLLLNIQEKQRELKIQEEQSKYFEEKTKAMEIEYSQDIPMEYPKEKKIQEKSIFKFIDDQNQKKPREKKQITKKEILTPIIKQNRSSVQKNKPSKIITSSQKINQTILNKPKIAIIIDDVTTSYQVKKILSIPYPITMSFLPPTKGHKYSSLISKKIPIYMIHLPLEASNWNHEEENTLHVGDSLSAIDKRILQVKQWYPNTRYINNHTGSKFTSNRASMDKLIQILKKYNYIFLDSKTASHTATKEYATKYNLPYLSRNIFLDNNQDENYIFEQLKKAIKIAKRRGFAIAIGHPHKITLKTLSKAKYLFKGLDVVLIDKIKYDKKY